MTTTSTTTQTTKEIGTQLVALCSQGKFPEAMDKFYDTNIVSIEASAPPGQSPEVKGREACKKKGEVWQSMHEVHGAAAHGPFLHGENQFAVYYEMDVTPKQTGKRTKFQEVGVYTVKNGKITQEAFYYTM